MADWVYVDNSNVFIEGKRVSAVKQGMVPDIFDAMEHKITDKDYRIDLGKLYEFIAGGKNRSDNNVARAMLFGSRPPPNDGIWRVAERVGFEVIVHDRNVANKEKKIDTEIATNMTRDAYSKAKPGDIFTLVAGDTDYVPVIEVIRSAELQADVVFWDHASRELKEVCSKFISLDDKLEFLRL